MFEFNDDLPIYVQIADSIEDGILNGIYKEDEQIPSTTEISTLYKINPATIRKGFEILVSQNIIYKKRGVGMFVTKGAVSNLKKKRKNEFYDKYILALVEEGKRLGITTDEIIKMIKGESSND